MRTGQELTDRLLKIADRAGFMRWATEYVNHSGSWYLNIQMEDGSSLRVAYPELDNYLTALELVYGA